MRIRIGKKGIIAAGIAGSVLLCGALFKMTTDSGVINNHEVAHVGTEHTGLSDAVKDLLDGNKETQNQNAVVEVDANSNAAVLAGVTMSEDEADANQGTPLAAETKVQEEKAEEADTVPAKEAVETAPDVETNTQTDAPVQETDATQATTVVEDAAPVEQQEIVESIQTVTVSTPVTQEVVTTVEVPVEVTVVEEEQTQSFKGALGGNVSTGADEAMQNIVTPEFNDDGVNSDEKLGDGDYISFE